MKYFMIATEYGYHEIENFQSHKKYFNVWKMISGNLFQLSLEIAIELKHTSRTIVGVQSPRLRQRHSHLILKNI